MKNIKNELEKGKKEEKVKAEKPKKEFKIEIVKVGKLEENTGGPSCDCRYACDCKCSCID